MLTAMLQKSIPDSYDFTLFLLVLLCFLTILFIVNSLADWLKSKPWKRNIPPEGITTENGLASPAEQKPEDPGLSDSYQIDGSVNLSRV